MDRRNCTRLPRQPSGARLSKGSERLRVRLTEHVCPRDRESRIDVGDMVERSGKAIPMDETMGGQARVRGSRTEWLGTRATRESTLQTGLVPALVQSRLVAFVVRTS